MRQMTLIDGQADDKPLERPPVLSRNTLDSYARDEKLFRQWCALRHIQPVPASPRVIRDYLRYVVKSRKNATARRAAFAIAKAHEREGYDNPLYSRMLQDELKSLNQGIVHERESAEIPAEKMAVLTTGVRAAIDAMYKEPPTSEAVRLRRVRDHAFLLLSYAGALTRDEARTLHAENVKETSVGLKLWVNSSERPDKARFVDILAEVNEQTDPVRWLLQWLIESGIKVGPVFRQVTSNGEVGDSALTPWHVSRLIKDRLAAAGLDSRLVSPQSLRRGFIAQSAAAGAPIPEIIEQTGHAHGKHIADLVERARKLGGHPQRRLGLS